MNNLTNEEITKGNKLIAEFMGFKIGVPHSQTMANEPYGDIDLSKFNLSWNWLMSVVERVENLPKDLLHGKFGVYISSNCCTIQGTNLLASFSPAYFQDHYANTKIEATWVAIVNFIEWYNNTLK